MEGQPSSSRHCMWGLALALATLVTADSFAVSAFAGTITGTVTTKKAKYRANTVVYVEKVADKTFAPPEEHVVIDQRGLEFIPHVLPVLAGTTVDFRNSDSVMHNVFTPDEVGDKFNLGSWPQGEIRSHTFNKSCETACEAVMLCNVHPEMEAYVVVLINPYFAVSDEEGDYEITGVPAGSYVLKTWHERLRESSTEITVEEDGEIVVNLTLVR